MPTSSSLSFAAALASVVLPGIQDSAEACGYVTPAVFLVTTHDVRVDQASHSLVRLPDPAPAQAAWEQASPMSYDATELAPAPSAEEQTFTLVSTSGRRIVTSRRQTFIRHDLWAHDAAPSLAVDVGDVGDHATDGYRVAIRGTHDDAKLRTLETRNGKGRIDLADLGVIETTEDYVNNQPTVHITRDSRDMGTYPGRVIGELETAQQKFIVVADRGNARAIAIW